MPLSVYRFFQILIALTAICAVLGYGTSLFPLFNIIVFLYPAYFSVLAIENANKEDKLKWLTYWVIYGTFAIVECVTGVSLYSFPAYHKVKSLFLMWCMAPVNWNGSRIIYMKIIRPFFYKHKPMVDELDKKVTEAAENVKTEVLTTLNTDQVTSSSLKTSRQKTSSIFGRAKSKERVKTQK